MDNPKDRGLKHMKNKSKYKARSRGGGGAATSDKIKPGIPQRKAYVELESNWDRYERDEDLDNVSRADFAVLANAPVSCGSHFQFKSDDDIVAETQKNLSSIFNLDLNLLSESLSCVSFADRSGIPTHYFTDAQRNHMTSSCEINKAKYDDYLIKQSRKTLPLIAVENEVNKSGDNVVLGPADKNIDEDIDGKSSTYSKCLVTAQLDSLDLSADKNITDSLKNASNKSETKNDSDLEQWLDDILDS